MKSVLDPWQRMDNAATSTMYEVQKISMFLRLYVWFFLFVSFVSFVSSDFTNKHSTTRLHALRTPKSSSLRSETRVPCSMYSRNFCSGYNRTGPTEPSTRQSELLGWAFFVPSAWRMHHVKQQCVSDKGIWQKYTGGILTLRERLYHVLDACRKIIHARIAYLVVQRKHKKPGRITTSQQLDNVLTPELSKTNGGKLSVSTSCN